MAAQRTLEALEPVLEAPPVRLMRVPDVAPPFDGEVKPAAGAAGPGFDVWKPRPERPGTAAAAAQPGVKGAEGRARDDSWAGPFARLLTETLAGIRPARQLAPWLTDRAQAHARRAVPVLRCGQRPRVLRVLVSWPSDGVAELSVIVALGPRAKALAIRMERITVRPGQPPRWQCTDIETA